MGIRSQPIASVRLAATGSAVADMSRQVGTVLGVSVLVAVIGSHASYQATHDAFETAWLIWLHPRRGRELVRDDAGQG